MSRTQVSAICATTSAPGMGDLVAVRVDAPPNVPACRRTLSAGAIEARAPTTRGQLRWLTSEIIRMRSPRHEEDDPLEDTVFLRFLSGVNSASLPITDRIAKRILKRQSTWERGGWTFAPPHKRVVDLVEGRDENTARLTPFSPTQLLIASAIEFLVWSWWTADGLLSYFMGSVSVAMCLFLLVLLVKLFRWLLSSGNALEPSRFLPAESRGYLLREVLAVGFGIHEG
jgi:hypothetical protein